MEWLIVVLSALAALIIGLVAGYVYRKRIDEATTGRRRRSEDDR